MISSSVTLNWSAASIYGNVKLKVQRALAKTGDTAVQIQSQSTAFKGTALKKSVRWRSLSAYTIRISSGLKHASFLELGTKPHVIRPKKARVLVFRADGRRIVTTRVNHPGTQPTKWLSKAVNQAFESSMQELAQELNNTRY